MAVTEPVTETVAETVSEPGTVAVAMVLRLPLILLLPLPLYLLLNLPSVADPVGTVAETEPVTVAETVSVTPQPARFESWRRPR